MLDTQILASCSQIVQMHALKYNAHRFLNPIIMKPGLREATLALGLALNACDKSAPESAEAPVPALAQQTLDTRADLTTLRIMEDNALLQVPDIDLSTATDGEIRAYAETVGREARYEYQDMLQDMEFSTGSMRAAPANLERRRVAEILKEHGVITDAEFQEMTKPIHFSGRGISIGM